MRNFPTKTRLIRFARHLAFSPPINEETYRRTPGLCLVIKTDDTREESEMEDTEDSLSALVAALVHRKAKSRLTRTATRTVDDWGSAGQVRPVTTRGRRHRKEPANSRRQGTLASSRPCCVTLSYLLPSSRTQSTSWVVAKGAGQRNSASRRGSPPSAGRLSIKRSWYGALASIQVIRRSHSSASSFTL